MVTLTYQERFRTAKGVFDAFTNKERIYTYLFRSGVLKKIKQQYNKRFRKAGKQEIQKG